MVLTSASATVYAVVSNISMPAEPLPVPGGDVDVDKLGPFGDIAGGILTLIVTAGWLASAVMIAVSVVKWATAGDFAKKRNWMLAFFGSILGFVVLGSFTPFLSGINEIGRSIF